MKIKFHIFKVHILMSFDIHLWLYNHCHDQNKDIHSLTCLLKLLGDPTFSLIKKKKNSLPKQAVIFFLSMWINVHFLEFSTKEII